jgi:phosphatidylglycerophosphatase A
MAPARPRQLRRRRRRETETWTELARGRDRQAAAVLVAGPAGGGGRSDGTPDGAGFLRRWIRIVSSHQRTARQRLVLLIGSAGPLGYAPASGTVTVALVGVPVYLLLHVWLPWWGYVAVAVGVTLFGVWIHGVGDRILGEEDSRKLVIDELAGFLIAMTAVPPFGVAPTWRLVTLGFGLERAIDIVKIWPATWIERRWPGGWGVVFDDVVAGLYTLGLLQLVMRFFPAAVGIG